MMAKQRWAMVLLIASVGSVAFAQPTPPRATITRDLRLDANTEDFPRVRFVYVGPQGQMAIPILNDMNVRMYDSTGKRLAVLGRKGRGPGEFENIFPMGWIADTLWASDDLQRRTSFYGPDLKLLRTSLHETFEAGYTAEQVARLKAISPNGMYPRTTVSLAALRADRSIIGYAYSPLDADPYQTRLVRVGRDKKQIPVAALPSGADERWGMVSGGYRRTVPFMISPMAAVAASGDRIAHMWAETSGNGGSFTVSAFRHTGDTMFVRTFPFAGVPIPARLRDSAIAAQVPSGPVSEGGGSNAFLQFREMARQKMPSVYTAVEQLLIGLDETFWVGLRRTDTGQRFLVLNSKGDPVASVDLPPRTRLMQASATRLYAVETDPDGLQSVIRFTVTGISCGAVSCR
jgi:hypothetical protein